MIASELPSHDFLFKEVLYLLSFSRMESGRSDSNRYLFLACRAWADWTRAGADGGNRTRRPRCGAPLCHRNTSPAWWSRKETDAIAVGARRHGSATIRVGRVGIEPTSRRIKSPLQSQRLLPTRSLLSSHPLESNQNLSGFNQARSLLR